jgi:hypothetical protein
MSDPEFAAELPAAGFVTLLVLLVFFLLGLRVKWGRAYPGPESAGGFARADSGQLSLLQPTPVRQSKV